jgi:hypothetical protein
MPSLPIWLHVANQGPHTLKLTMVALELDLVVVVLGPVWAAVLLIVLSPMLPIPCANKGMLRVSARGEAAREWGRESEGGVRGQRQGGKGARVGPREEDGRQSKQGRQLPSSKGSSGA